jgi:hypothetical protein
VCKIYWVGNHFELEVPGGVIKGVNPQPLIDMVRLAGSKWSVVGWSPNSQGTQVFPIRQRAAVLLRPGKILLHGGIAQAQRRGDVGGDQFLPRGADLALQQPPQRREADVGVVLMGHYRRLAHPLAEGGDVGDVVVLG